MFTHVRALVMGCAIAVASLPGYADEVIKSADVPTPAPQLELSVDLSHNAVVVGSLVACRIVVANHGGAATTPVQLRLTASNLLRPIGGRGATPVRVRDDDIVIDDLPSLDHKQYAEWYIVFGTEQAGGSSIFASVTANLELGPRALEAQATLNATGFDPGIDVDLAEMQFERARELLNSEAPETAAELLRVAVTKFDAPMFKASAYHLIGQALERVGRTADARYAAEIARVLVAHAWAPESRWVPELVRETMRNLPSESDDGLREIDPIQASSAITGRVYTGDDRTPLVGAVVSLDGSADGVTMTDDQGYFILSGMALDRYVLTVSKPGYITRTRGNIDVRDFVTLRVDFRLVADAGEPVGDVVQIAKSDGGAISGIVIDAQAGHPLSDVSVFLEGPQRTLVRTNGEGVFETGAIAPGSYIATWSKPGYFRVTRFNISVNADEAVSLRTELAPQLNTVTAR